MQREAEKCLKFKLYVETPPISFECADRWSEIESHIAAFARKHGN